MTEQIEKRYTSPRLLTRALRYGDEASAVRAQVLINQLTQEGPFMYYSIPSSRHSGTLLPEWSYKLLVPLLEQHGIRFREVRPIPMSGLPVEEQARIRRRRLRI